MRGQRLYTLAILTGIAIGLWQFGHGTYIYAKAFVAQGLIASAWNDTLQSHMPTKPWTWADTWPISRLRVPRLGVDLYVLAGDNGSSLAFGPGHRFGTAAPGENGNCLISGHRDTHFAFLKELKRGDGIWLQTMNGEWHIYEIDILRIADQNSPVWRNPDQSLLTLVTCYPFDAVMPGGPLRFVVQAEKLARVEQGTGAAYIAAA